MIAEPCEGARMRLWGITGIAATLGAWGFVFYIAGTCTEDCGDSGLRGAFLLAVMASLTALPIGIALLMPGFHTRSRRGRSVARWVLLAGALANALVGLACVALAVHFVSEGPTLVVWFGVLPAVLFGAVALGFVRWALSLR